MNYLFGPPVPIKTSAADFLGFPVVIDPLMEPGTLEFHDNAGCVVGRIVNPATSPMEMEMQKVKPVAVQHDEFLRLAYAGLVLRGYDRERDIPDAILRKVWRLGKRALMATRPKRA